MTYNRPIESTSALCSGSKNSISFSPPTEENVNEVCYRFRLNPCLLIKLPYKSRDSCFNIVNKVNNVDNNVHVDLLCFHNVRLCLI